jgi:hypothetical protein
MIPPIPKIDPINDLVSLSNLLSVGADDLLTIEKTAISFYKENKPKIKPNGKLRRTFRVISPLIEVQQNILIKILNNVIYPYYLMAIKDSINKRDYIKDASIHSGNVCIIELDIADFFPSVRKEHIFQMWKGLFLFPDDVAKILTGLTTYKNMLPQGAKTSSAISNLIFWNYETSLAESLQKSGFIYSRYVDDITISTNQKISITEANYIINQVKEMMLHLGLNLNEAKQKININNSHTQIHGLNVSHKIPTIPRKTKNNLRVAIKELNDKVESNNNSGDVERLYLNIIGRLTPMRKLNNNKWQRYKNRLDEIMRIYNARKNERGLEITGSGR